MMGALLSFYSSSFPHGRAISAASAVRDTAQNSPSSGHLPQIDASRSSPIFQCSSPTPPCRELATKRPGIEDSPVARAPLATVLPSPIPGCGSIGAEFAPSPPPSHSSWRSAVCPHLPTRPSRRRRTPVTLRACSSTASTSCVTPSRRWRRVGTRLSRGWRNRTKAAGRVRVRQLTDAAATCRCVMRFEVASPRAC